VAIRRAAAVAAGNLGRRGSMDSMGDTNRLLLSTGGGEEGGNSTVRGRQGPCPTSSRGRHGIIISGQNGGRVFGAGP